MMVRLFAPWSIQIGSRNVAPGSPSPVPVLLTTRGRNGSETTIRLPHGVQNPPSPSRIPDLGAPLAQRRDTGTHSYTRRLRKAEPCFFQTLVATPHPPMAMHHRDHASPFER